MNGREKESMPETEMVIEIGIEERTIGLLVF